MTSTSLFSSLSLPLPFLPLCPHIDSVQEHCIPANWCRLRWQRHARMLGHCLSTSTLHDLRCGTLKWYTIHGGEGNMNLSFATFSSQGDAFGPNLSSAAPNSYVHSSEIQGQAAKPTSIALFKTCYQESFASRL
ncbi:hypothetical protein B0H17DRAFT_1144435 [Mycena rosella]|uniref:Uncharacterized protein n=1 Tax=Mycena rosella TaxID=1033263 RepID=A0AAD7CT73_MYCRO|nr:hypothetical protein B0H17DRAFT_1144435 [Mycena rosella]